MFYPDGSLELALTVRFSVSEGTLFIQTRLICMEMLRGALGRPAIILCTIQYNNITAIQKSHNAIQHKEPVIQYYRQHAKQCNSSTTTIQQNGQHAIEYNSPTTQYSTVNGHIYI